MFKKLLLVKFFPKLSKIKKLSLVEPQLGFHLSLASYQKHVYEYEKLEEAII